MFVMMLSFPVVCNVNQMAILTKTKTHNESESEKLISDSKSRKKYWEKPGSVRGISVDVNLFTM